MSGLIVINAVMVTWGAAAALTAVGVYALSGAKWWANQIGRFLVLQGTLIGVLYLQVMQHLITSHWLPQRPITTETLTINACAVVLETYQAWAFFATVRLGRRVRRARRRAEARDPQSLDEGGLG